MSLSIPSRPQVSREKIEAIIRKHGVTDRVVLVGVRGYFRNTMGKPGNDRGIWDDALIVVTPTAYATFNGNTDPSIFRPKIASLVPGVHRYKKGKHGLRNPSTAYPAFRPATPGERLPVRRDGVVNPDPGVAINIHRGGVNTTSSEGCQTVPPSQWNAFYELLSGELSRYKQPTFPYVLIENDGSVA